MMQLIALVRNMHVLPRPGGLFDQDSFFVYMLAAAEDALAQRIAREQAKK